MEREALERSEVFVLPARSAKQMKINELCGWDAR